MEDNLKFVLNGRRPEIYLWMEDELKYICEWRTTSNIFVNGRRPQILSQMKDKYINLEDDLNYCNFGDDLIKYLFK